MQAIWNKLATTCLEWAFSVFYRVHIMIPVRFQLRNNVFLNIPRMQWPTILADHHQHVISERNEKPISSASEIEVRLTELSLTVSR